MSRCGVIVSVFKTALHVSVAAAAFLAFGWPFAISRDQDSPAYHALAIGVLLLFFASLVVLCGLRLRTGWERRPG